MPPILPPMPPMLPPILPPTVTEPNATEPNATEPNATEPNATELLPPPILPPLSPPPSLSPSSPPWWCAALVMLCVVRRICRYKSPLSRWSSSRWSSVRYSARHSFQRSFRHARGSSARWSAAGTPTVERVRARHSTVDVEAGVDHLEAHLRRLSSEKLPPASFDAPVSTEPSLASAILAASTGGAGLLSPSSLRSRAYADLRPVERGALPEDDVAATTPLVAGREATASSAPREGGPPPRSATERRAATERPKGGGTAKRFRRRAPSPPPGVMIPPDTAAPPQWSALEWVTHQESVDGFAISVRSFDSTSSRGRSSGWAVYAGSADEVSSGDVSDGIARASSAAPRQQRPPSRPFGRK
ncbi:hypothetical protein EMIHUDRAFT_118328 [Emiliania huxleyi CCMP1516]|uniref:Uncharacterized protein n=2 Tax=Emiliania huxleyi TaxID=2903 RepID=A0A0D3J567_EMIH1|nr:hypothetical protein EMIHUDRAFT_118328 [Emiliania huxleyi CCMP1516]EOD18652.1 hypothetical protein EMIHUDRAFT_118328 [Emiliania huxleyi CCMP1516]|eukprot:XP_005771081.1 hypothetical protein EMIHUDRAFT_118328 [Emiliania huxleyi CCMP1516]